MVKFVAPKFKEILKRAVDIPMSSPIAANTQLTLVVGPIPFQFRVVGVEMVFRNDAAHQLRHYWLVARNRTVSATGVPSGRNVFGYLSPTGYFIGEGITKRLTSNIAAEEAEKYIKLHTNNLNAYAQTINCSIRIVEM